MANEECQELKNIKYKNMLLSGNSNNINSVTVNSKQSNIDLFLDINLYSAIQYFKRHIGRNNVQDLAQQRNY